MNVRFEQPFETPQRNTAHSGPVFGDPVTAVEEYSIADVDLPSGSIQPLEDFQVGVTFEGSQPFNLPATSFTVDLDHPDDCSVRRTLLSDTVGAELLIEVESEITERAGPGCYDLNETSGIASWSANVPAVTQGVEGTQTITVNLVGATSGEVVDSETREVVVDTGADPITPPPDDPEDPINRILDLLPGDFFGGGFPPGGATGGLAALVVILLLLLVVSVAS